VKQIGSVILATGCATIVVAMAISHHIVQAKNTSKFARPTSVVRQLIRPASFIKAVEGIAAQNDESPTASPSMIPKFSVCSANVDIASLLPGGAHEDPDVKFGTAFITQTEQQALGQIADASSLSMYQQISVLGEAEIYDVNLSPLKNIACATCHVPYTGFRGESSFFNATTAAQPGGVPITNATPPEPNYRIGPRNPQSYGYAAFAPILHYDATQASFYGGNFWDMRATGTRLGNAAAEQAEGPPVNPVEMGNIDTACVVWKASQSQYASLIESIWGAQSFAIQWPSNVASVCAQPGPPPTSDPLPVHLSAVDRGTSNSTYDHIAMAMATYESSADVSPFSSKFDAYLAGTADLSSAEIHGYELFNGKARCNQCHLSGTAVGSKNHQAAADVAPLFTDFTANNIGLPKNLALPYYCESKPDQYGYTANPMGFGFVDLGVGGMLSSTSEDPNYSQWSPLAPQFNGMFQTPTLRNADKRPRPDFIKEYMHNGYLKSLKEVVHFYNTSQALPRCPQGSHGEKNTCWPPPEYPGTLNTTQLGNLGLSNEEEDDIVAFLRTLTDGYVPSSAPPASQRKH
jgi:cytochrome c peroxidase